jgi:acylphosphatase
MIKRMYVEAHNLKPLIDWLKTKPSGELKVLIGGSENATQNLMTSITKEGRGFAQWVVAKMQAKELSIHSMLEKPSDLELGVVVESET